MRTLDLTDLISRVAPRVAAPSPAIVFRDAVALGYPLHESVAPGEPRMYPERTCLTVEQALHVLYERGEDAVYSVTRGEA